MKNSNEQIEKTLKSLDNIEQATAPNFFETRLKATMEKRFLQTNNSWLAARKPVWIMASLTILLCINIYLIGFNKSEIVAQKTVEQPATIESFATAYQLTNTTAY